MKKFKKATSLVCALALVLSLFAGAVPAAHAALGYWPEPQEIPNEYYAANQTLQPYGSCFQIDELKHWSPDNDPDARYNRGAIPLRERWMGPNVNPLASRDAKIMPLAMSNARASQSPSQGGDGDFVYAFNNFQYVDTYNFWGGSSGEGPIAIPSPEIIDSAHRNGVPATGTIFIPWGDESYGSRFVSELVEKDENGRYPAGDKLIEIAQYYGFDGYIFNAESGTGTPGFKEFLIYLQENKPENFTISWYNGSNAVGDGSIQAWMQDGDTKVTDAWWLDMSGGWSGPKSSVEAAERMGVSPWNIHSTWEYWPMKGDAKGGNYQSRLGADGKLISSLGILAPTSTLTQSVSSDDFINNKDTELWVNPDHDPSSTARPESVFCGFSSLVTDRTPIIGTDFVTNFTTGNGYKFYEDGQIVGKVNGWYNRSMTDVLPTWRWIIESDGPKLNAKVDFDDAWFAGTSLKFSGLMSANMPNHVKLYSCQLDFTETSEFEFVYKTPSADVDVELGLCFGDTYAPENFEFFPITVNADGQWNTATLDLSQLAGRRAIAISLRYTAPSGVSDYSMNVGRMAFTTNKTAPGAVADVTLDDTLIHNDKTMEARIYWDKADDAFMYRVYRIHQNGFREFIAATPSDALYLGTLTRDDEEATASFEIVPYTENGVAGEATSFSINWPALVPDGYVMPMDEGLNVALGVPAVCNTGNAGDGPVHLINDGVVPSSKWCGLSPTGYAVLDLGRELDISRWVVYHANCPGAGEGVAMNTVDFSLQYAPDDGEPLLTGDDPPSKNRVAAMKFEVADTVVGNKLDITDRNLNEPIRGRYIKLNITRSDNSPWSAIRIYEFELYEKAAIDNTPSPNEKNVTVINNVGPNDIVVVDNVPMPYSSGSYPGGSVSADTGVVRLFDDLTTLEPFATVKAEQPENTYKMRAMGKAVFTGLDLKAEGGRLYFDVLKNLGAGTTNSRRSSVAYAPETGEAAKLAESVAILPGTSGEQIYQTYASVKATGLAEGASLWVYADETSNVALGRSLPAEYGANRSLADGEVVVHFIPLETAGGSLYYEVHQDGMVTSARTAIPYGAVSELPADLTGLAEWVERCSHLTQGDCTSATWGLFAEKRAAAEAVLAAGSATVAEAEAARVALAEAYKDLRLVDHAYAQRLAELCDELEAKYPAENYQPSSYKAFADALAAARAAIAGNDTDRWEMERLSVRLVKATKSITATLTGISISPAEVSLHPGDTQEFKIITEGDAGADDRVTWQVQGNHSAYTSMSGNILTVGHDEAAEEFTVKAISHADPNLTATATVTVLGGGEVPGPVDKGNVALGATVVASDGPEYGTGSIGHDTGPEKLFDGVKAVDTYGWWGLSRPSGAIAFDLGRPCSIEEFVLYHIGSAPGRESNENTYAYEISTLNTEKISVEDFLAADFATRNTYLADDLYWTEAVKVTNNTEAITNHAVALSDVQIVKFHVTRANNLPDFFQAVQICELEAMGAAEGVTPPVDEVKITVDTDAVTVVNTPGMKNQFTATVTGSDNVQVLWSISGNTSEDTRVDNGLLFLGHGEEAEQLIVTAAAAADPTKTATITVTLVPQTYAIAVNPLIEHGLVSVSAEEAAAGETITVTVQPDEGYKLVEGSLKFNSTLIEGNSFVMPAEAVIINASFEEGTTEPTVPGELDRETNVAKDASVIAYSGSNLGANDGPEKLFDGQFTDQDNHKWGVTGNNNWVAFDIGEVKNFGELKLIHAGAAGEWSPAPGKINTDSYEFYVLNTEKISVEDLLAKSYEERCTLLANAEYWTLVASRSSNLEDITVDTLDTTGRIFKINVSKSDSTGWAGFVRLYELEMYAYAGDPVVPETYDIVVNPLIENGVVTVSTNKAAAGETVTVTVEPAEGYKLVEGSLKFNDTVIVDNTFVMPAEPVVVTAEFEANQTDLQAAAQAAKEAAEAAQAAAEEAQLKAEEAQAAAEAAAAAAAEDQTAAEAARVKAEEAQAAAEAAQAAAEEAKTAAEAAQTAAEQSKVEAALEAEKAAAAAAEAAQSALTTAEEARKAASAQAAAQEAQAAAEAAQKVAEQAAADAKAAQEAADQAAESSATDKEAAEKAMEEAAAAKQAAEDAKAAAENAAAAAEAAKNAAEASNEAAAKSAAEAAKSAEAAARSFQQITELKKELAQYLEDAQKAKEEAEAAKKAAEAAQLACAKYEALFALSCYVDEDDYRATEQELLAAAIDAGVKAINAAETPDAVKAALKEAQAAIDEIPTAEEQKLPFTDVKEGDWYENAVRYVYRNDLFNGVSETEFAPRATMTRGQMITVLFRLAGEPEVENNAHPFKDVREDAYYKQAVIWGYQTGIVSGTSDDAFSPDEPITRAQAAAFLFRLSGDEKVEEDHLKGFADVKDVPAYAVDALNWAVANEILNGAQEGENLILAAGRQITRAEVATLIMRCDVRAEMK